MTTEGRIKLALREMMLTKPLNEINAVALCEKAHCNRQTFYYHYQDIYDVLASILLKEQVPGYDEAKDIKNCLISLIKYASSNFKFLTSCYNSAARDLVDEFFYSHIMNKVFGLLSEDVNIGLSTNGKRNAARRYASFVSQEFGYCFKTEGMNQSSFERRIRKFCTISISDVFPAILQMGKSERQK